jgi:hypothetical protein
VNRLSRGDLAREGLEDVEVALRRRLVVKLLRAILPALVGWA